MTKNWKTDIARPNQLPPESDWSVWAILAGRGYGKTRSAAEYVHEQAMASPKKIILVPRTMHDARDVMIEGQSGLFAVAPEGEVPVYEPSKRRLKWPNGSVGFVLDVESPDDLRGPQADLIWADEPVNWKWKTFENALLAARLGDDPKVVIGATPRGTKFFRKLVKLNREKDYVHITYGSTFDNGANLSSPFIEAILNVYWGTRSGLTQLFGKVPPKDK